MKCIDCGQELVNLPLCHYCGEEHKGPYGIGDDPRSMILGPMGPKDCSRCKLRLVSRDERRSKCDRAVANHHLLSTRFPCTCGGYVFDVDTRVEVVRDGSWNGERGIITYLSEHGFFVVKMDNKELTLEHVHSHERWRWDRTRDWPTANFEPSELRKLGLLELIAEAANAPDH